MALHAHSALFWFALVVSTAVDGWRARLSHVRPLVRYTTAAVAGCYVAALLVGLQLDLVEMRASGERSRDWRRRIHAAAASAPRGSTIRVRGLPAVKSPTDYGLYRVTPPGYLLAGTTGVAWAPPGGVIFCGDDNPCERAIDFVLDVDERGNIDFGPASTQSK